jgi:hypothetical protein
LFLAAEGCLPVSYLRAMLAILRAIAALDQGSFCVSLPHSLHKCP